MLTDLDRRRILIFLGFAFGIAWLTALVIYLTGGLTHGRVLARGIPLALVLLATTYMWAPALANIFTRLVTREGWQYVGLRPYFKRGWPYWIYPWVLPAVLTVLGAILFFVLMPQYYGGLDQARSQLQRAGLSIPANLELLIALETLGAVLISPPLNVVATFGEEFGWRAYLLPKLMPLGGRQAVIILGLIWGVWHWPVIAMGYEFGMRYPGFPWSGMMLFLLLTISGSALLSWVALHGRSVWPAAIGHAALNGIGNIAAIFTRGQPPSLLGPAPVGLIALVPFLIFALILFLSRSAFEPQVPNNFPWPAREETSPALGTSL